MQDPQFHARIPAPPIVLRRWKSGRPTNSPSKTTVTARTSSPREIASDRACCVSRDTLMTGTTTTVRLRSGGAGMTPMANFLGGPW